MSWYDREWGSYVSVADRRAEAEREVENRRRKGQRIAPVAATGRTIATTFWGKAWCENLERYRDYESRLPRGRSYIRNGFVIDLQIAPRVVTALVQGSSVYKVRIDIAAAAAKHWQSICRDCAGGIDSLIELLQGRFSKPVMERLCQQGTGLFPRPSEIKLSCSCLDHAAMCKHVAAALYGVGARLDAQPELLFRLRAVDENDLLAVLDAAVPLATAKTGAGKVLHDDDLAALFGLDMAGNDDPPPQKAKGRTARPKASSQATAASAGSAAAFPVAPAVKKARKK